MIREFATAATLGVAILLSAGPSRAAEEAGVKHEEWPQAGMFGTFDRAALQRGFQVFQNVCSACHNAKYLAFRTLSDLGYDEESVKAIAAGYQIQDGPNDEGEMFERPGRPSDHPPGPFPNDQAARAANGGALPPDLSLIIKAREGGEDYVYSVLTGYEDPPEGVKVNDGQYYNAAYPGHLISMPPPLSPDQVQYGDQTPATVEQMAHDVTTFLSWVSEPKLEARKQAGVKVVLFLIVLVGLLFAYKRRIWADLH